MPKPVPLSVVIITKNEESRLKECLDSAVWAGEIVLVDDESTDRTVEIARRYTDRVISRKMDIEGRHRNFAYAQARYDWVFSLDADERFTPELRDEIIALLQSAPQCTGYSVPRRNYLGTQWLQHGGWYPSPQLKLFRKDRFRYEESEVHPRVFMEGDCGRLTRDLIHYSYRNLEDFVAKLNRQTTLEARKWVKDGRRMTLGIALWRTLDRFWRSWWMKKADRDGPLGFVVSVLAGFYQLLSYGKYWHAKTHITGPVGGVAGGARGIPRSGRGRESPSTWVGSEKGTSVEPVRGVPLALESGFNRLKLSAVILTKNAADQIDACLDSIRWMDEIIVVDGGSTDGTAEKAAQSGAKVVTDPTPNDFGRLRNLGSEQATGDWVLQLDADEVVTPEFRRALEQILLRPDPNAAYKFRRQNIFLGRLMRFGGWDHDSLHLFRRGRAHYEGRVHEKLLVRGSIGRLRVGVLHSPFRSLEEFVDRQNRYTTLEAQQILEEHGGVPEREIRYQMTQKPVKLFWKMVVKKQGFREGTVGLIFSALFSFVHFLKWAKVLEKETSCAS